MLKRGHIALQEDPVGGGNWGYSPGFRSCWTHLSRQRPAMLESVDCCQHREGAVGILGQTAIAHLGKAPQALEDQEGMFDLRADARLTAIRLLVGIGQRGIPISP